MGLPVCRVAVNALRVYAFIGVMEQERRMGNEFLLDITLEAPLEHAMANDDVDATINYAEVVTLAQESLAEPCQLLEHAVWRLHRALTTRWPQITAGTVTLAKLKPPIPHAQLASASFTYAW